MGAKATALIRPGTRVVARLAIILPDDYDPSQRLGRRARGYMTAVDLKGGSFNLLTLSGEKLTFQSGFASALLVTGVLLITLTGERPDNV